MAGHDRTGIISARQQRHAKIVADADRLKATAKDDRPGDASLNDVREAYADAMDDLAGEFSSVAGVEAVALPSDRLGGGP